MNTPTQVRLYNSDGTLVRALDENRVAALGQYKSAKAELMRVKTRDGFEMEALMIRPPDFDPSKKYPVMSSSPTPARTRRRSRTRGAATPTCGTNARAEGLHRLDTATTARRAARASSRPGPVYSNFGELELRDLEDGVAYLKTLPYVDGSRIGIWGWSFGGYMTSYALTHSKT